MFIEALKMSAFVAACILYVVLGAFLILGTLLYDVLPLWFILCHFVFTALFVGFSIVYEKTLKGVFHV